MKKKQSNNPWWAAAAAALRRQHKKKKWFVFVLLSIGVFAGAVVVVVVFQKEEIANDLGTNGQTITLKKQNNTYNTNNLQDQQSKKQSDDDDDDDDDVSAAEAAEEEEEEEITMPISAAKKKKKKKKKKKTPKPNNVVEWVLDPVWFRDEEEKGCCPFAEKMYRDRYERIEYRCCRKSRLFQNRISPLRATGGSDYRDYYHYNYYNHNSNTNTNTTRTTTTTTTVVIQGDSLAEQHFLGMVCMAWSEEGLEVDLRRLSDPTKGSHQPGTLWEAKIRIIIVNSNGDNNNNNNDYDDDDSDNADENNNNNSTTTTTNNNNNNNDNNATIINLMTIQHYRWDRPELVPNIDTVPHILRYPDYLILNGWHHGKTASNSNIANYLELVRGQYNNDQYQGQQPTATTNTNNHNNNGGTTTTSSSSSNTTKILVAEALPSHFPGGKYVKGRNWYPPANTTTITGDRGGGALLFRSSNSTTTTTLNTTGEVCDRTSFRGDPDINDDLARIIDAMNNNNNHKNNHTTEDEDTTTTADTNNDGTKQNNNRHDSTTIQLLSIRELYSRRGDAHIGVIPSNKGSIPGPSGRDCLHFCVAPGVLDALVRTTLAAMIHY